MKEGDHVKVIEKVDYYEYIGTVVSIASEEVKVIFTERCPICDGSKEVWSWYEVNELSIVTDEEYRFADNMLDPNG